VKNINRNKVRLIIFEGIDCCGKSSQMLLAYDELIAEGHKVIMTREPGGTPLGEKIREILKSDIEISDIAEAYLFATARAEHNVQINEWIEEGYIVLCDRHFISSYAYQGIELAREVNRPAIKEMLQDNAYRVFYFDINHEEYLRRNMERNEDEDRFENLLNNFDYFTKVKYDYDYLAEAYNAVKVKSMNKSTNEIHEVVMKNIYKIIEEE
jgi:dTMP kinase